MKLDKKQRKIVKKLAAKYNIETDEVMKIIESPFVFIRKTITNIDLQSIETEEEFKQKLKNFNIPGIGKLYANIYSFKKYKKYKDGIRQT
jgi:hypothetical protein